MFNGYERPKTVSGPVRLVAYRPNTGHYYEPSSLVKTPIDLSRQNSQITFDRESTFGSRISSVNSRSGSGKLSVEKFFDQRPQNGQRVVNFQKYIAKELYSHQQRTNNTTERLPPAKFSRGLVANGNYASADTNGQAVSDSSIRSLPNSSTQHIVVPKVRHVTSAPGRKSRVTRQETKQLPKVNNFVNGNLPREEEFASTRLTRRDVPAHAKAVHVIDDTNIHGHGKSTKENALKPIENTKKFASNWAGARVDHLNRSPDPHANFTSIRDNKEVPLKKNSTSKPTHKDSSTSYGKSLHPDTSLNTSTSDKKELGNNNNIADKNNPSSPRTVTVNKRLKDASNKENNNEKHIQRSISISALPPRRDRTRAAVLRKVQSQAALGLRKISRKEEGEQNNASRADASAKIYYNSVLQTQNTSADESKNTSGCSENDLNISLTEKQIPPWHRKEYVLSRKEAATYKQITNVYGNKTSTMRKERQKRFLEKLEKMQLEKWKQDHENYQMKQRRRKESKHRQNRQLKEVRDKFEDEQARRFASQYVTSRILEQEWFTRHIYGLPEDINYEPLKPVKIKSKQKKPKESFDTNEMRTKNIRKFSNLFDIKTGPTWDPHARTPKMEGYDTIMLEEMDESGNVIQRHIDVQDILGDAQYFLNNEDVEDSPPSPGYNDDEYDSHPSHHPENTSHQRENTSDSVKRKNTVHFNKTDTEPKRERRYGVIQTNPPQSAQRNLSRENTKKESAHQQPILKKNSAHEKKVSTPERNNIPLPKKDSPARKISSFAPLLTASSQNAEEQEMTDKDERKDKVTESTENNTATPLLGDDTNRDNLARLDKVNDTKPSSVLINGSNDQSVTETDDTNRIEKNTDTDTASNKAVSAKEGKNKATLEIAEGVSDIQPVDNKGHQIPASVSPTNKHENPYKSEYTEYTPIAKKEDSARNSEPLNNNAIMDSVKINNGHIDKEDSNLSATTNRPGEMYTSVVDPAEIENITVPGKDSGTGTVRKKKVSFNDQVYEDNGDPRLAKSENKHTELVPILHKNTDINNEIAKEENPNIEQSMTQRENEITAAENKNLEQNRTNFSPNQEKNENSLNPREDSNVNIEELIQKIKPSPSEVTPDKSVKTEIVRSTSDQEIVKSTSNDKLHLEKDAKEGQIEKASPAKVPTPPQRKAKPVATENKTVDKPIIVNKSQKDQDAKKKPNVVTGPDPKLQRLYKESSNVKKAANQKKQPEEHNKNPSNKPPPQKKLSTTQGVIYYKEYSDSLKKKPTTPSKSTPPKSTASKSTPSRSTSPKSTSSKSTPSKSKSQTSKQNAPPPKPRSTSDKDDIDSLDLADSDDEDVFERAMKKYGIVISDDEED